jgi:Quercetinase C-terminal cupin domain
VNGENFGAGDAAKLTGISEIAIKNGNNAEVLVFDLA